MFCLQIAKNQNKSVFQNENYGFYLPKVYLHVTIDKKR